MNISDRWCDNNGFSCGRGREHVTLVTPRIAVGSVSPEGVRGFLGGRVPH